MTSFSRIACIAFLCLLASLFTGTALAQDSIVVGANVNMVTGESFPNGDPFLRQQNEPSVAFSSRNSLHLLSGANDYRAVDVPGLPGGRETGDSWLSYFWSTNGGATWKSITISPSLASVPVNALGISPDYALDTTVVVSLKGRGLYRTTDGGQSFTSIGQDLLAQNLDLKFVRFSPDFATDKTLFAATDEVLVESRDSGLSWSVINRPVRYEDWRGEDRGPIRFYGEWTREFGEQFSASTQAVTEVVGAQATLNFNGTDVAWHAERGPNGGRAIVTLDGEQVADIDLYHSESVPSKRVFHRANLDNSPHNILISVSDTSNQSSGGKRVSLDSLDVWTDR